VTIDVRRWRRALGVATALAVCLRGTTAWGAEADLGALLPMWSALPFAGMLLSIALFPLLAPAFWHHHYPKVAAGWAGVLVVPFVAVHRGAALHELAHVAIVDYVPFIILLGTLFTIGGGTYVRGRLRGTPGMNAALASIGTVLASWVGTTGAAMLLVRPLLRANRERRYRAHTMVFFIFLVSNIGGSLTPLGDPPLFLGFLHGVPFFWTFTLWKEMLVTALCVLGAYVAVDLYCWGREDAALRARPAGPSDPIGIDGAHNFLLLGGVLVAVILSGTLNLGEIDILGVRQQVQNVLRDVVLIGLLLTSWFTTARHTRTERVRGSRFARWRRSSAEYSPRSFRARDAARRRARRARVRHPCGARAGALLLGERVSLLFLDNAPTYLTFLSTALGRLYPGVAEREAIAALIRDNHAFLQAISTGSVFMGRTRTSETRRTSW
jgi:Na+/H+ antiporter NhaD/arsenite permease-like protein